MEKAFNSGASAEQVRSDWNLTEPRKFRPEVNMNSARYWWKTGRGQKCTFHEK